MSEFAASVRSLATGCEWQQEPLRQLVINFKVWAEVCPQIYSEVLDTSQTDQKLLLPRVAGTFPGDEHQ